MDTTVSYWIRHEVEGAEYRIQDVVSPHGDVSYLRVVDVANVRSFNLEITPNLARDWDVIRRVSAPRPTPDALSYVVTFANLDYVTPGGKHPEHQVELWSREPLDADDVILEDMAWGAAEVWPEAGWADDNMAWWLTHVTLPDGSRINV